MAESLSEKMKEALHLYYMHRDRQSVEKWNKAEDLDRIFNAATEEGWSSQACAGKFWFSKKGKIFTQVITVTESTFRNGGISNIQDNGKPFGLISELADALRKTGKEPFFIRDKKDLDAYADLVKGDDGGDR